MGQDRGFSVPHEIDEILELLPPQVTLNVPDHVLAVWFPPAPTDGGMDGQELVRAQSYAQAATANSPQHS